MTVSKQHALAKPPEPRRGRLFVTWARAYKQAISSGAEEAQRRLFMAGISQLASFERPPSITTKGVSS